MLSNKHLVFLEVAQNLSFTRASEVLFISQPAISKHIQALEEDYHTSLFERNGRGIELTEPGKILQKYLLKVKLLENQLDSDFSQFIEEASADGFLKLGASTTVALYIIPPILAGFQSQNPHLNISLLNRNSDTVLKALLNNEIDIGIIEGDGKKFR